ncbi:MAG: hypothetical protein HC786_00645 [Richelia sp. CSU_2_1]|nr:hypothetical protein [Microcoleus sp. SM1_3_4]NJR20793.1 hypothetical protein [Richelia sp. CSU_2_1]
MSHVFSIKCVLYLIGVTAIFSLLNAIALKALLKLGWQFLKAVTVK